VSDNREAQLLAMMTRDAAEFARRELAHTYLIEDGGEDKIAQAKKKSELKRLARARQGRIAAGLPVNRPRYPSGAWSSGEHTDGFRATDGVCVVCGGPIVRDRSRTCSARCARAMRAARKAVNHTGAAARGAPERSRPPGECPANGKAA
jgi:hypothetical protein